MSIPATWPQFLNFFCTPLVLEPSPGQLSGDAGLLPIRYFDQRIGFAPVFVRTIDDPRNPDRTKHRFLEMVRARVDDRKGVEARLKTYPQDLLRHHGVYREFTTRCTVPV